MVSKHLFTFFSSSLIFISTNTMESQRSSFVVVAMGTEPSHDFITERACALLNVNDKKTEDALRKLLRGSATESPEQTKERTSIIRKLSNSPEEK